MFNHYQQNNYSTLLFETCGVKGYLYDSCIIYHVVESFAKPTRFVLQKIISHSKGHPIPSKIVNMNLHKSEGKLESFLLAKICNTTVRNFVQDTELVRSRSWTGLLYGVFLYVSTVALLKRAHYGLSTHLLVLPRFPAKF